MHPLPPRPADSFARRFAAAALAACAVLVLVVTPAHASRRAVVVSLDGLRPDVALRADMPALRALMARGCFTFYAATTDTAITLPSHTSMLTGVAPAKHGILYNADWKPGQLDEPLWPTLFELAHRAGMSTAMSAGKSKFALFARSGAVDRVHVPPAGSAFGDSDVAAVAAGWIAAAPPRLLFVHLPSLDLVGHAKGWGSPEQVADAANVDRALALVLGALVRSGDAESTLVIVSADHGGAGNTHGGLDARSRYIPWIVAGPGVRRNFDLTQLPAVRVRTEDTFATAAAWLGLALAKPVDGHAVSEIFAPADGGRPAR